MCIVYGLNYLDKTTLSYASVMGISKPTSQGGIGLVGDNYNWLGSMFYFGYLACMIPSALLVIEHYSVTDLYQGEFPTNRLLQYLPLGKYSAFNIIMWGLVLACFAAVKNFSGAVAIRFFLGVFEAAVSPGFALFTSQWYVPSSVGPSFRPWHIKQLACHEGVHGNLVHSQASDNFGATG